MTKLKNRVRKEAGDGVELEFDLKNVNLNGRKLGCTGYIANPENGRSVYVDTKDVCGGGYAPLAGKAMVRYEENRRKRASIGSGPGYGMLDRQNQWLDADRLAAGIVTMLTAEKPVNVEFLGRKSAWREAIA